MRFKKLEASLKERLLTSDLGPSKCGSSGKTNNLATRPNGHFIYSEDGSTPVSMKEWLTNLRHDAPHLFQPATGGGSGGASTTNVPPPLGGAVDWSNPAAVGANLEDIAKGKVVQRS